MRLTPVNFAILLGSGMVALAVVAAAFLDEAMWIPAIPVGMIGATLIVFRPYLGVWFIAFFTQMDAVANTLFAALPISINKLLTLLAVTGMVIYSSREPLKTRWGTNEPVLRLAALYFLTLLISGLFIKDLELGWWSVRRLSSLLALLYLVVRLVNTMARVKGVVLAILVSTFMSACILIADFTMQTHLVATDYAALEAEYAGISRTSGGSDYNPTTAATMMLAGTTLGMMLFFRTPKWRWLTGGAAVLGSTGIVLSYARSAGLVYAIMIVWLFWKFRKHRNIPAMLAGGLLIATITALLIPESYWERLLTLTDWNTDDTLMRRLGYNLIGVQLLVTHPLLGVGPGQFQHYYIDPDFRYIPGRTMLSRQLHNMYLEVASETGLIGVAFFLGILIMGWIALDRLRRNGPTQEIRDLAEALHFAYIGYLMVSVFVPNEYNKYTWILSGLAIAFANVVKYVAPPKET